MNEIDIVTTYAARWGVAVDSTPRHIKFKPTRTLIDGPGGWSIRDWAHKPTIVRTGDTDDEWPYLLHELAHCVWPIHPQFIDDELATTTGFEILTIRHLKLPRADWNKWQNPYGLAKNIAGTLRLEWNQTPAWWRSRQIRGACDEARRLHLFDSHGRPTYERPPRED